MVARRTKVAVGAVSCTGRCDPQQRNAFRVSSRRHVSACSPPQCWGCPHRKSSCDSQHADVPSGKGVVRGYVVQTLAFASLPLIMLPLPSMNSNRYMSDSNHDTYMMFCNGHQASSSTCNHPQHYPAYIVCHALPIKWRAGQVTVFWFPACFAAPTVRAAGAAKLTKS